MYRYGSRQLAFRAMSLSKCLNSGKATTAASRTAALVVQLEGPIELFHNLKAHGSHDLSLGLVHLFVSQQRSKNLLVEVVEHILESQRLVFVRLANAQRVVGVFRTGTGKAHQSLHLADKEKQTTQTKCIYLWPDGWKAINPNTRKRTGPKIPTRMPNVTEKLSTIDHFVESTKLQFVRTMSLHLIVQATARHGIGIVRNRVLGVQKLMREYFSSQTECGFGVYV